MVVKEAEVVSKLVAVADKDPAYEILLVGVAVVAMEAVVVVVVVVEGVIAMVPAVVSFVQVLVVAVVVELAVEEETFLGDVGCKEN